MQLIGNQPVILVKYLCPGLAIGAYDDLIPKSNSQISQIHMQENDFQSGIVHRQESPQCPFEESSRRTLGEAAPAILTSGNKAAPLENSLCQGEIIESPLPTRIKNLQSGAPTITYWLSIFPVSKGRSYCACLPVFTLK